MVRYCLIVLICLIAAYAVRHVCVMCASSVMFSVMMKPRFLAEGEKEIVEEPTWRDSGLREVLKECFEWNMCNFKFTFLFMHVILSRFSVGSPYTSITDIRSLCDICDGLLVLISYLYSKISKVYVAT